MLFLLETQESSPNDCVRKQGEVWRFSSLPKKRHLFFSGSLKGLKMFELPLAILLWLVVIIVGFPVVLIALLLFASVVIMLLQKMGLIDYEKWGN